LAWPITTRTAPTCGGTCRGPAPNCSRCWVTAGCPAVAAAWMWAAAWVSRPGYLASAGWRVAGVDLSETAARRAAAEHGDVVFVRADVRRLPFAPECFDAAVDRGCFHYLRPEDRPRYSDELRRVLRPGGKYLLRASLRAAGVGNDIDEAVIAATFAAWTIEHMERAKVPSDTRMLEVIVARMSAPQHHGVRCSRSAADGYT
jgi:SAM-dependent methyltransferase